MDVDHTETLFRLERMQDKVALVSQVPVKRVTARPAVHSPA